MAKCKRSKKKDRLKYIQINVRAKTEEYNRIRIEAARVFRKKKREALQRETEAVVLTTKVKWT